MSAQIDARLSAHGLKPPSPAGPAGDYTPYVISGNLVFISGQISRDFIGRVGVDLTLEEGRKAAQSCALHLIAQLKEACGGDLQRVRRVVKLTGFVACGADFTEHAQVINGASAVMTAAFEDAGRHARAAVGCASLPLNAAVEVDGVFEIA